MSHIRPPHRPERAGSRFSLSYLRTREEFVFLLTPGGRISFVSDSVRTRLPLGETLSGRDWSDLWPEAERHRHEGAVARAARGDSVRFETRVPGEEGGRWDVTVSPIHDTDGRVETLMAVLRVPDDRPAAEADAAESG